MSSPNQLPPQVGDTANLLLKKLVTATQVLGTSSVRPGGTTPIFTTSAPITTGAGAGVGTLTNAPAAGNPTKWIPISDNGTTRYIPAW